MPTGVWVTASLHFFDGRGATPFAGVARSSKMTRSSAPEFRSADGSRLHSGECAQSLDVLIPTRRVARLLRGTRLVADLQKNSKNVTSNEAEAKKKAA